jgi:hypothetical protein|tara:strand:+ start:57 stop:269 length:213 start_codon:yes stop_codon:yes gene_type:complete
MTTGSTVIGTVQGLAKGIDGAELGKIVNVIGDPDGVVVGVPTSGVAWDGTNGQHYMAKATNAWIKLGSIA